MAIQLDSDHLQNGNQVIQSGRSCVSELLKGSRGNRRQVAVFRGQDYAVRFQAAAERQGFVSPSCDLIMQAVWSMAQMLGHVITEQAGQSLYFCTSLYEQEAPAFQVGQGLFCFTVTAMVVTPNDQVPLTVWINRPAKSQAIDFSWRDRDSKRNYFCGVRGKRAEQFPVRLNVDPDGHVLDLSYMNFFAVIDDVLHTPCASGPLFPGIVRHSIMRLARSMGVEVVEAQLDVEALTDAIREGRVTEAFATGMAGDILPIKSLREEGGREYRVGHETGTLTQVLRTMLLDIQDGRLDDVYEWMDTRSPHEQPFRAVRKSKW